MSSSAPTSEEKLAKLEAVAGHTNGKVKPAAAKIVTGAAALAKKVAAGQKRATKGKPKSQHAAVSVVGPAPIPVYKESNLEALPKGEERQVALKDIIVDESFQMRCQLFDEFHVGKLEEAYKDEADVDPIRLVETMLGELIVYEGFQRTTAANRVGKKTINALVTKGTRDDALFWAMRSDSAKALPRTRDDCRRTVLKAINNPDIYARIKASSEKYGGLGRAMAVATSTSKGTVANVLKSAGLVIKRGEIVKEAAETKRVTKRKPEKEDLGLFAPIVKAKAAPEGMPATFKEFEALSATEQKQLNAQALANLNAAAYADRVSEATKIVKRLGALVATLLLDREHGEAVREALKAAEMPVAKAWDYAPGSKEEGEAYFALLEKWPTIRALTAIFKDLGKLAAAEPEAAK